MYSGYRIAFDGKDSWSFNDDTARKVIIFVLDNTSSSHTDNIKNDFLVLGEGDTLGINGNFGAPEKKSNINFRKAKTKFCLSLHCNRDNSYLFVNGKEIYKFNTSNNNNNFSSQFRLGSISNKFGEIYSKEVPFKGNVFDFSVDYDATDKSNISNIHRYLMIKNSI